MRLLPIATVHKPRDDRVYAVSGFITEEKRWTEPDETGLRRGARSNLMVKLNPLVDETTRLTKSAVLVSGGPDVYEYELARSRIAVTVAGQPRQPPLDVPVKSKI